MDNSIRIIQKNLTANQIQKYCEENKELFVHTLFARVKLEDYSDKLCKHALHFCAFYGEELAGLMACYFNHPLKEFGYVTTISVINKFQKKGIAQRLMNYAIGYGKRNGFKKISLEVNKHNLPAIALYNNLGFHLVENKNDSLFLELSI